MVYTEIKEKNGKKYFYRVQSIRKGNKILKKRLYLGVNLDQNTLKGYEDKADKDLLLLSTLLTKEEFKELDSIKKEYISQIKKQYYATYEAFVSLFTYDSTNIEGNTLTLQETTQLLFEGITPRKLIREIKEVLNHKEAFDYILDYKKDISKEFILKLHEIVTKETLKPEFLGEIGKYRSLQVYIRGVSWLPPKPQEVPQDMASLLSWYTKNKKKVHPIILAAYFHSAFETIHPFVDGNGRVGRLLINFILHKNNFPMINIPNKERYIYYETLEQSQIKGNLRPLVKFLFGLLKKEKIKF